MLNERTLTPDARSIRQPDLHAQLGGLGRVCRLGLATRGDTRLEPDSVLEAVRRGVNYLNWCSHPDGLSAAVRKLAAGRSSVFVAAQFYARTAREASKELAAVLGELSTSYIDVLTFYYLEERAEWERIRAPGGAFDVLVEARREGTVRAIGVTTHQRKLAAEIATSGEVDLLMVRYNAAHVGAEEIFPMTRKLGLPVVTYTGLRWGALLRSTPYDPPDFVLPRAPEWYRFVLCHPAVTVGIMAPDGDAELEEDLRLLDDWRGFDEDEYRVLREHGERVHRHASSFP